MNWKRHKGNTVLTASFDIAFNLLLCLFYLNMAYSVYCCLISMSDLIADSPGILGLKWN